MGNRQFDDALRADLRKLIQEKAATTVGVVLRLAWDAGLMRSEICDLLWEQVDFQEGTLHLPDREVPISEELQRCLQEWKASSGRSAYVVAGSRRGARSAPAVISHMARSAFDRAGMESIRLADLRRDYILRQYAALDSMQAAMATGVSSSAYRMMCSEANASSETAALPAAPLVNTGEAPAARENGKWTELDASAVKALEDLLASEPCSTAGVILRLAWRAGLLRDEINELRWDQVDFSGKALHLPDRNIPMDQELERCLRQWKLLYGQYGPFVVISEQRKEHMAPQSLSRIARLSLNSVGLRSVRLADLHYDYILRQFKSEGWEQALRSTGLALSTARQAERYKVERRSVRSAEKPSDRLQVEQAQEETLRAVLKSNTDALDGIALWLSYDAGLLYREIIALTWEQVDLTNGLLHLEGRDVPLSADLTAVLRQYKKRRQKSEDPHVILLPTSRKPISVDYLALRLRDLLVRNGIDCTLRAVNRRRNASDLRDGILKYVVQSGGTTGMGCARVLNLPDSTVRKQLRALVKDGLLEYSRGSYFPPGTESAAAQREAAVKAYLAQHGESSLNMLSEEMRLSASTVRRVLDPMVQRGEISKRRKRFAQGGACSMYALIVPAQECGEVPAGEGPR